MIEDHLRNCEIFIFILFRRYGMKEPGDDISRTERELRIALDMLNRDKRLIVLPYLRDLPKNDDPGQQEKGAVQLRQLVQESMLARSYATPEAFRELVTHDLYDTVLRYRLETRKHRALQSFWQLGTAERPAHPRLVVVYPPVDTRYMRTENPDAVWLTRLMPNLVFEDFKALQKIDKSLRLIGFNEFSICSTAGIPSDVDYMNRVWLCLPRSVRARKQLERYTDRSRVQFVPRRPDAEARLRWRCADGSWTEIRSPLSRYLEEQRRGMGSGEWTAQKGKLVARDFAVLTRFIDRSDVAVRDRPLVDYFLAGIRGLGTWGAGWFIDRKYPAFLHCRAGDDIQMLLEVTYRDERIDDVRDVSSEPPEYFETQNDPRVIEEVIEDYRDPDAREERALEREVQHQH